MNLLIASQGRMGSELAQILQDWIKEIFSGVKMYSFSTGELIKEKDKDIVKQFKEIQGGLICITEENLDGNLEWLHFQAGLLFQRQKGIPFVAPLLLDIKPEAVSNYPLSLFQTTVFGKQEIFSLLCDLNNRQKIKINRTILEQKFETTWTKANTMVRFIPGIKSEPFTVILLVQGKFLPVKVDPSGEDIPWEDLFLYFLDNVKGPFFNMPDFDIANLYYIDLIKETRIVEPALSSRLPTNLLGIVDSLSFEDSPTAAARYIKYYLDYLPKPFRKVINMPGHRQFLISAGTN